MGWFDWLFKPKPKPAPTPTPVPTPTPTPVPTPTPTPTPTPDPVSKIYGVATETFAEVAKFNQNSGKPVNVVSIYKSFFWDKNFPTTEAQQISTSGAQVMITWEPWEPNGNATQSKYSLASINRGDHDTIIKAWASQIKSWNNPLFLRFAHEMNGNWYPWGTGNGSKAGEYISAYKHVRAIFDAAGVTNVKWVWSPNVDFPVAPYYPGDSQVDYVALDGYNWDTSSPEKVFGETINNIREVTQKPIFIGETGCPSYSGKAQWITNFFKMMKDRNIIGFVWFNYKKEQDWRIESSTASINAFKTGISAF